MGFDLTLVVAKQDPHDFFRDLGIANLQEEAENPLQEPSALFIKQTGYIVVLLPEAAFEIESSQLMLKLSERYTVYVGAVAEFCMNSMTCCMQDGELKWSVYHDGDEEDVTHLETLGDLPEAFSRLKKEAFRLQRAQDHSPSTEPAPQHMDETDKEIADILEELGETSEFGDDALVDHVFEVPMDLLHDITGFRHDQVPDGDVLYWSINVTPSGSTDQTESKNENSGDAI